MLPTTASSISGSRAASTAPCSRLTLAASACASSCVRTIPTWMRNLPSGLAAGGGRRRRRARRGWRRVAAVHLGVARPCAGGGRGGGGAAEGSDASIDAVVGGAGVGCGAGGLAGGDDEPPNQPANGLASRRSIVSGAAGAEGGVSDPSSARPRPCASARARLGTARRDRSAAVGQSCFLVGRRALAQGVGAIGLAQSALQPQRAGQIGDGLRRLLLLPVGDAAIEQCLGHDGRRQVAAGEHGAQRLRGRLGLAGLEQLQRRVDGALGLGRILSSSSWLVLGGGVLAVVRLLGLGLLGFGLGLLDGAWAGACASTLTTQAKPRLPRPMSPEPACASRRAIPVFPRGRPSNAKHLLAHKLRQFVRTKQMAVSADGPIPQ